MALLKDSDKRKELVVPSSVWKSQNSELSQQQQQQQQQEEEEQLWPVYDLR